MQINVIKKDGSIENHNVPEPAGSSIAYEDGGKTVTDSMIDVVADVINHFSFTPEEGGILSRRVVTWIDPSHFIGGVILPTGGTVTIITPEEAAEVSRIEVDGAPFWPKPNEADQSDDALDRIDHAIDRIEALGVDEDDDDATETDYDMQAGDAIFNNLVSRDHSHKKAKGNIHRSFLNNIGEDNEDPGADLVMG